MAFLRLHKQVFPVEAPPYSLAVPAPPPHQAAISYVNLWLSSRTELKAHFKVGEGVSDHPGTLPLLLLQLLYTIYSHGSMADYPKRCLDVLGTNIAISWHYYVPATVVSTLLLILI